MFHSIIRIQNIKLASGVMVCTIEPASDSIENALKSGGLLEEAIHAPFYDLVSKIGRELVLPLNDGAKSNTVLAQDTRFMSHLEDIHHNFESEYQHLIELRRNLKRELPEIP